MIGHREMSAEDYVGILRRRIWFVLVPLVLGPAIGIGVAAVLPERYTSQTLVLVEQQTVPVDFVRPVVTDQLNDRLGSMREQILSRTRLQPIIERFDLFKEAGSGVPMESQVAQLRKAIVVTPVQPIVKARQDRDLPGFFISVTLSDGRMAQQVCAEITAMFLDENLKHREQRSQNTTDFLSKELDEKKLILDSNDKKLAEFKQRFVGQLPGQEQATMNMLLSATASLDAVNVALSRAQQDKVFLEASLAQRVAAWEASKSGTNPITYEQQLNTMKNNLVSLEARYTNDHPDVVKARADIAQFEKKIAEVKATEGAKPPETKQAATAMEPPDIQQARAQIYNQVSTIKEKAVAQQRLQEQIRVFQARVQLSPVVEQQHKELTRDYETALNSYNDLLKKKGQSEIATNLERRQQGEQFRMVDPANLPEKPSFPDRLLFAGGGAGAGLGLGLGLIFLLEFRDKSLRTESDVEALLGLPTLALIPVVGGDPKPASRSWMFGKRRAAPAHGSQA